MADRLAQPRRHVTAIYVIEIRDGKKVYVRQQYNIVALNWGDGTPVQTFQEPVSGRPLAPTERQEVYDDVAFYNVPPYPLARIGE